MGLSCWINQPADVGVATRDSRTTVQLQQSKLIQVQKKSSRSSRMKIKKLTKSKVKVLSIPDIALEQVFPIKLRQNLYEMR